MKIFLLFLKLILGNAVLLFLLALDATGAFMLYFDLVGIPSWLLWLLPVLGLIAASYKVFLKRHAGIAIQFNPEQDIDFSCYVENNGLSNSFLLTMKGYIHHNGLWPASLDRIKASGFTINSIHDAFIMERLNIELSVSDLMHFQSVSFAPVFPETKLPLPMVLPHNTIVPFKLFLLLRVNRRKDSSDIQETIEWMKELHFNFEYAFVDGNGETVRSLVVQLPVWKLKEVADKVFPGVWKI